MGEVEPGSSSSTGDVGGLRLLSPHLLDTSPLPAPVSIAQLRAELCMTPLLPSSSLSCASQHGRRSLSEKHEDILLTRVPQSGHLLESLKITKASTGDGRKEHAADKKAGRPWIVRHTELTKHQGHCFLGRHASSTGLTSYCLCIWCLRKNLARGWPWLHFAE